MRPLLENELLSVRLYAARQADSAELLRSCRLPRVVTWWAMARLGFTGEPGARWLVRRRMVQRRRKLTRFECLASFRAAEHPLACLSHAARLVELHGQDAIPALLEVLPRVARSREHGEAVAWALGTLGRPILAEVMAALRSSSQPVRQWLLLALWFLGPEAHGAERELLAFRDPMAEAVLLNLESRAAARVARDGRAEVVYLDEDAVCELAGQIYGHEPLERRRRAVRALKGFGPAVESAIKLLGACLDQPELAACAARTLVDGHPDEALRPLLRDGGYLNEIARLPDLPRKLQALLAESGDTCLAALQAAHLLGISVRVSPSLVRESEGLLRLLAMRGVEPGSLELDDLRACARDPHPACRLAAARLMAARSDSRDCMLELIRDEDVDVATESAVALLHQAPDDEALALELLSHRLTRRRILARMSTLTPAILKAQSSGLLPRVEDFAEDGPQLNTYTREELEVLLDRSSLQRLKHVANADLLFELILERLETLSAHLIAFVLRHVGPRLEDPRLALPLRSHPEASVREEAERLLEPGT